MSTKRTSQKDKVLNYLLEHSQSRFYLTEIARATKVADSTVQHILENQIDKQLIKKEKVGNLSFFSLKADNPLVKQAKAAKTIKELNPLIEQLKTVAQKIILFGSCARGEEAVESDIDLFVLSNSEEIVLEIVKKSSLQKRISLIVKNYPQLVELKKKSEYLYEEINKGIVLWEERYG